MFSTMDLKKLQEKGIASTQLLSHLKIYKMEKFDLIVLGSGPGGYVTKLTCLIGLVVAPILGGHASHS